MSHIRISQVTHMYESRHTYERVMSPLQNLQSAALATYECITSHKRTITSHVSMSHITHINESCDTNETCRALLSQHMHGEPEVEHNNHEKAGDFLVVGHYKTGAIASCFQDLQRESSPYSRDNQ